MENLIIEIWKMTPMKKMLIKYGLHYEEEFWIKYDFRSFGLTFRTSRSARRVSQLVPCAPHRRLHSEGFTVRPKLVWHPIFYLDSNIYLAWTIQQLANKANNISTTNMFKILCAGDDIVLILENLKTNNTLPKLGMRYDLPGRRGPLSNEILMLEMSSMSVQAGLLSINPREQVEFL